MTENVRSIVIQALSGLQAAEDALVGAIFAERKNGYILRDLERKMELRVIRALLEAGKEGGALSGIAKTSKQYEYISELIRDETERADEVERTALVDARRDHYTAQTARDRATVGMDAAKARTRLVQSLVTMDRGEL